MLMCHWGRDRLALDGMSGCAHQAANPSCPLLGPVLGCEADDHVEKIIRRYVGRSAAVRAMIAQLDITKK